MNRFRIGVAFLFVSACSSTSKRSADLQTTPVAPPATPSTIPANSTELSAKEEERPAPQPAPRGAQSITISLGQISSEIGVPRNRLEQQAQVLARFMDTRRMPAGFCSNDDNESTERLCSLVDLIENNPTASGARRLGGRRVPIRPHHFKNQQAMGYGRLMRSIHREPVGRVMAWAPRMLAVTSCPRNLSAVALRKLESGLPSSSVRSMMEKLYEHAVACLRPQDEGYEITHLRQALLRLQWGMKDKARLSMERAAIAEDSTDRPRVLYWAGRLQTSASSRDRYWNKLIDEAPLSFHSLEVWRHRGQDPLQIFESRPPLALTRHVDNEDIENAMRWLEALYVMGRTEPAQKLARWINTTYKDEIPPSTALYISALKSSKGTPLNTITFLTRQVNENPSMLNQQTLRLLFPRPFYDVFDRNAPDTDTALVLGVARQESGFNPRARSPANAQGLLQLLPSTARILSGKRRNNLYDSETNARLGIKFLSNLIDRFDSVELALAGYNAGPGRVDEWKSRFPTRDMTLFMDLIPYKETRHYVANIVRNYYWYERLYSAENAAGRSIASSRPKSQRSRLVARLVAAHESARGSSENSEAEDF